MKKSSLREKLKKLAYTSEWLALYPFSKAGRCLYELGANVQYKMDWAALPNPDWFDHELDLAMFKTNRQPHFWERGVYASEVVAGKTVLDLCCGDGSIAALFISPLAKEVLAIDVDVKAIKVAKKRWSKFQNCLFEVQDVRKLDLHGRQFDVCLWDATLEYFSHEETEKILNTMKSFLSPGAILHGSTVKKRPQKSYLKPGRAQEYEFDTIQGLQDLLAKHFKNVEVWERHHSDRTNFYYRCSDSSLPTLR